MIPVTETIQLQDDELIFSFIRSPGPGGQNVNKVATAVQMRFDIRNSPSLSEDVKERLERLAGSRSTNDGIIVISARLFRSQERNRLDAIERLILLMRQAAHRPKTRKPTRPSFSSKQERLDSKARRSRVKQLRGTKVGFD